MKHRSFIYIFTISALVGVYLIGCTSYGKFLYHGQNAGDVTIETLVESCNYYHIYYSGYGVNNATGILFDPKADNKTLKPSSRWVKVEDQKVLTDLVAWLKVQDEPQYYPGLFTISRKEGQIYGYLYSGWYSHGVAKVIDDNTFFVFFQFWIDMLVIFYDTFGYRTRESQFKTYLLPVSDRTTNKPS